MDSEISRTVDVRKVTPNLILKSAAVLHSSLEASVASDLLSFVLQCRSDGELDGRRYVSRPIDGRVWFFGYDCDRASKPMLQARQNQMQATRGKYYAHLA